MNKQPQHHSATILPFPRKRGRPRSALKGNDTGTPELVMKRLLGETAETLDLCLERQIISKEQHWCGIHLRWLYTLRHGAPGVRAIDPTHLGGIEIKTDDPEWRHAREKEYHEAIHKLDAKGYAQLLLNICIYNERPQFLTLKNHISQKYIKNSTDMIDGLKDGLDILVQLWSRPTRKK